VSHKVRSKEDPASHFDVVGISIHREDTVREREPLELPPSIDSTARRAAALPNRVHDIHGSPRNPRRHRMKDQTLDQQVEYLAKKSSRQTSFQNLLKAEGESQSTATTCSSLLGECCGRLCSTGRFLLVTGSFVRSGLVEYDLDGEIRLHFVRRLASLGVGPTYQTEGLGLAGNESIRSTTRSASLRTLRNTAPDCKDLSNHARCRTLEENMEMVLCSVGPIIVATIYDGTRR
jgi:hypothetical protein